MYRTMVKSEIRSATVTHSYLYPAGSLIIDAVLLDAADILPGELVSITNISNGARFQSHAASGNSNSGILGISGAAAHLVRTGDLITIATYASIADDEAKVFEPRVVQVDSINRLVEVAVDATDVRALAS